MHSEHEIFIRAIEWQRRLKVTYTSDERREKLIRRCGPLYCSRGKTEGDELECYYLWDFEADEGYNFLALSSAQILSNPQRSQWHRGCRFKSCRRHLLRGRSHNNTLTWRDKHERTMLATRLAGANSALCLRGEIGRRTPAKERWDKLERVPTMQVRILPKALVRSSSPWAINCRPPTSRVLARYEGTKP